MSGISSSGRERKKAPPSMWLLVAGPRLNSKYCSAVKAIRCGRPMPYMVTGCVQA